MPIELLIFDLDGVLVESEVLVAAKLAARLNAIGIAADPAAIIRRFHYRPHAQVAETLAREQGATLPPGFLDALPEVHILCEADGLVAVNGADAALAALDLPKCIASGSAPAGLSHKLEMVGLTHHFAPHLFSSYDVPRPKPAPDVFLHAAQSLNTPPANCLVVEDAVVGIQAARAAGMHALGFCGGQHCHDGWEATLKAAGADGILHHLADLPAYIDRLRAQVSPLA